MEKAANFKVFQASAGAGKTFTLIKEYLKLCLKNENSTANFRNILAITFTNAAANEMKAKIMSALVEIIDSKEVKTNSMEEVLLEELGITDEELKRNAQSLLTQILHDYSSFCVSTIDAFVQKLSRSFAHDLGLPSQYSVSIDTDEVAETITERLGLRITKKGDYITDLLIDFSNNQFDNQRSTAVEKQLSEFIAKLMTEKAYQKDEKNSIKNYPQYKETLDFLNGKMRDFEQGMQAHLDAFWHLEKQFGLNNDLYAYGKNGFVSYIRKLSAKVYEQPSPRFIGVLEKGSCFSKDAEKQLGKGQVEVINAALLPVLQAIKDEVDKGLAPFLFYKSQRDLLYLYALRAQIRMEFEALANEEEIVHISEFNKLLNSVMGDFSVPFVYERIGEHFRHVFVDEFQDTSILQWHNLLPLIDNGLANGNMSMVVGDGKQSIYRFRSGEVEQIVRLPEIYGKPEGNSAFQQYEQKLKDSFAFKNLDTNYRSFAQVVKFNNTFFESVYTNLSSELQKVYKAEKPGTEEMVDIIQKIDKKDDEGLVQVELYNAEDQPDYCFERVETIIRDLTETKGYQYSDIALLTRKSDYGSKMANYLNDKGIPVISQDSILLKSSDKVQLMVNALRYLINGDNETVIANVLYYWKLSQELDFEGDVSPFFGEVKAIAKGETAIESVLGLGEAGMLEDALAKATCLYDLCANLLRIFRFDTIHDAFINFFMDEVFKAQSGIKEGIADFLTYWDTKQNKLAVMSVGGNAVKIMTIHKSKGLEFPVVIYPDAITDLDEKLNASRATELWLHPYPDDLDFEAIPHLDKVLFKLDKNAENMGEKAMDKVNEEKDSNRLDNLNLLYVAFTRAKQRLYIIAKQGKEKQTNIIRDFLKDDFDHYVPGNDALVYRFGSPDFMKPKRKEEKEKKALRTESIASDWFGKTYVESNPTFVWQSKSNKLLPREFGELVHQILAKVRIANEMDSVLSPYVSDGTINQETADWIRGKFVQMTQNQQISAAFNASAKVKTECEILYHGKVIRLDRYAELPDVIYLIDYKTGKKDEEHQKQVSTYAHALKEMTDKEIRAYLVYLSEAENEVHSVGVG